MFGVGLCAREGEQGTVWGVVAEATVMEERSHLSLPPMRTTIDNLSVSFCVLLFGFHLKLVTSQVTCHALHLSDVFASNAKPAVSKRAGM